MITIPFNFDGDKFIAKFGDVEFHVDGDQLVCPSQPNLTEADLADCVVDMEAYQRISDRTTNAESNAKQIPGWAMWDAQQAGEWANTNLVAPLATIRTQAVAAGTLAAIKPVFIALIDLVGVLIDAVMKMGRLVIALRDRTFPRLPE
jgi:hypothetical protein